MTRPPGKPFKVERKVAIEALKKRKSEIFRINKKVISKLDKVWNLISQDLNYKLSARTLYSMVCNPIIRKQILCETADRSISSIRDSSAVSNDSVDQLALSIDEQDSFSDSDHDKFTIWSEKCEFEKLLEDAVYKRRERGKQCDRQYVILKPGLWQDWFTKQIWNATRLRCAFNFENSRMTQDAQSGLIQGTCDCGGTIECRIDNSIDTPPNSVRIDCVTTKGKGRCGKRYLRAPLRQTIGRELCTKSAAIYRTEKAEQMMLPGDPEPPHLYDLTTLTNAKHEYLALQHLDRDPIRALQIMKRRSYLNSIHEIGVDPFFVYYWTNHQMHMYRAYAKKEPACIAIDATGSIIKSIDRCDQTKTGPIFLYHAVVHNKNGQFSVAQLLSERHTTVKISSWLSEWASQVVIYPKEVVCDSSKAPLGAAIKVFTNYSTIEDYASACSGPVLPSCYVRIDVAHFLKMYANFLKTSSKRIKTFYLATIGQLILVRNVHSAGEMLRSILLVARSETDGNLPSGEPSQCEQHKMRLKDLLNPSPELPDEKHDTLSIIHADKDSVFDETPSDNYWLSWARDIDLEVTNITNIEEGNHDNAHHLPRLADRIFNDIRWFPLWSCVCRDRFNYGRVPATSAYVKSEFNLIKTHLLGNELKPMRADDFVAKHLNYLGGRTKIIDARTQASVDWPIDRHIVHAAVDTASPDHKQNLKMIRNDDRDLRRDEACRKSSSIALANEVGDDIRRWDQEATVDFSPPPENWNEADSQACTLCSKVIRSSNSHILTESTICPDCEKFGNTAEVLASRETEKWRGLVSKAPKRRNRYLQKNHATHTAISLDKLEKILIMRNGNDLKMQASKFGKKEYTFTNTCVFDSVLHAILVVACDKPAAREAVKSLMHVNPLFHLVEDNITRGLRAHSYHLRADILIEKYPPIKTIGDIYLIDCATNVCGMVGNIFIDTPSVEEVTTCSAGCEPRVTKLRTICVPRQLLMDAKFEDVIMEHVAIHGTRPCPVKKCPGLASTQFSGTGPFILIEVDDGDRIAIDTLPRNFKDPLRIDGRSQITLIGIIDFEPPAGYNTRLYGEADTRIGRYTAISLRSPDSWMEFDDSRVTPNYIPAQYKAKPHLLIYFEEEL